MDSIDGVAGSEEGDRIAEASKSRVSYHNWNYMCSSHEFYDMSLLAVISRRPFGPRSAVHSFGNLDSYRMPLIFSLNSCFTHLGFHVLC